MDGDIIKLDFKVKCPFCEVELKELIAKIGTYKNAQIPRTYSYSMTLCPHCQNILPINVSIISGSSGMAYSVSDTPPNLD